MAVKDKEEKKPGSGQDEGKGKKKRPLLKILLIFVPLLLIGGAAAYFFLGDEIPFLGHVDGEEAEALPRYSYSMAEFQVNLADSGTRRFLRTTFDLAYDDRGLTREIEEREPELRSEMISILRSKYIDDLEEPGGMKDLEAELIEMLNDRLESGEVKAIYYKEFIFQ